jgi:hypothetical protein
MSDIEILGAFARYASGRDRLPIDEPTWNAHRASCAVPGKRASDGTFVGTDRSLNVGLASSDYASFALEVLAAFCLGFALTFVMAQSYWPVSAASASSLTSEPAAAPQGWWQHPGDVDCNHNPWFVSPAEAYKRIKDHGARPEIRERGSDEVDVWIPSIRRGANGGWTIGQRNTYALVFFRSREACEKDIAAKKAQEVAANAAEKAKR